MGTLRVDNTIAPTTESIPNKDRSRYNLARWKWLLDAPFPISHECCTAMKKSPIHIYQRKTKRVSITGQMADESMLRKQQWLRNGCNGFDMKQPISNPMSFWTEQDVLHYIKIHNLPICSAYGDIVPDYGKAKIKGQMSLNDLDGAMGVSLENVKLKTTGCSRTGCMFCGFGCHLEKEGEGRFLKLKESHPVTYDYIMRSKDKGGLGFKEVIDWLNEHGNLHIEY